MVVDEYETLRARSLANVFIADSATDDQARLGKSKPPAQQQSRIISNMHQRAGSCRT